MEVVIHIYHVLSDNGHGGVPVGVVLDADVMTSRQKQHLSMISGVPEVVFVSNVSSSNVMLEYFNFTKPVAHCDHAALAAYFLLEQSGHLDLEDMNGERHKGATGFFLEEKSSFLMHSEPRVVFLDKISFRAGEHIYRSVGLSRKANGNGTGPCVVNSGVNFLLLPMGDERSILNATPDFSLIEKMCEAFDLEGFYLFSTETENPLRDAGTRMFSPRTGMDDAPATVKASAVLSYLLYHHFGMKKEEFLIEQGKLMTPKTPCLIRVKIEFQNGEFKHLSSGGSALFSGEKTYFL